MREKTVGLTGATGALGRRIAKLVEGSQNTRLVTFKGDLRIESDLQAWVESDRLDTLILSAAVVPLEQASKNPSETFRVNAHANLSLVLCMQSAYGHVPRVCYVSSSHVYGSSPHDLAEDSILHPASVYGRSKLLGERLLFAGAEAVGFDLLVMRVFSFFADDQHESHLYPTLLRRLAQHPDPSEPFQLAGWNNVRDFTPADEIASTVVDLSMSDLGGVINVGSGIPTSVGDFASSIYGEPLTFRNKDASSDSNRLVADTTRLRNWAGRNL